MVNRCEAVAAGGRAGDCWHAGMLRSRVGPTSLVGRGRAGMLGPTQDSSLKGRPGTGKVTGRRRAAEGRGVASPRPPAQECTINRAPTIVRPAANKCTPANHPVSGFPLSSKRPATRHLKLASTFAPRTARGAVPPSIQLCRDAVPTLPTTVSTLSSTQSSILLSLPS